MALDSNLLLTAERFHLEPRLVRGGTVRGTFALKRPASRTYLVVSELQGRVLEEFAQPRTVPEVLETCIRKRSCPALRDFYDLVLKAHRAGILRSEELGAEGPRATRWETLRWLLPLPRDFALFFAGIGFLATAAAFALKVPIAPVTFLDVLTGWAAAAGALCLGQLLAASILPSAGGEISRPHLGWTAFTPHLALDLADIRMTGRHAQVAIHAMTLLPLALLTGAGLWWDTPWNFAPLAVLLLACRPVGGGTVSQLLLLLRRRPLLDTDKPSLFEAELTLAEQCRAAWRRFDGRVAVIQLLAAIVWAGVIGLALHRGLDLDPTQALRDVWLWERALAGTAAALAIAALWWSSNAIQYQVADAVGRASRRLRTKWRRWISGQKPAEDPMDVETLIRRNPLLRQLSPERQAELARLARPFSSGAWRTVVAFDAEPQFVGLVVSGSAAIYRRRPSGRASRLLNVMEGDLFGAHALVDPDYANLEIRTRTPLHAVVFDVVEFKLLVVDSLGANTVRRYVHNHLFLQRASPICAEWRPAAIARLAELSATAPHSAGGKIISQGQEIGNLYVLYEGRARALNGKKSLGRIKPGDFFGEVGLLQSSTATADVETNEDGRHLVVNRVEFIRFLARNHHVALQIERLCSKRLGHPVFPIDDRAVSSR